MSLRMFCSEFLLKWSVCPAGGVHECQTFNHATSHERRTSPRTDYMVQGQRKVQALLIEHCALALHKHGATFGHGGNQFLFGGLRVSTYRCKGLPFKVLEGVVVLLAPTKLLLSPSSNVLLGI